MKTYERNQTVDVMKGLSTILVMYIHSHNIVGYAGVDNNNAIIQLIAYLTYAAVPTFFLISAYLMSKSAKSYAENVRRKAKTLLLPYIIWISLYIVAEAIGNRFLPIAFSDVTKWNGTDWMMNLIGIPFADGPIYGPLWFVRDLFLLSLIAPILKAAVNKIPYYIMLPIIGGWYLPLPERFRQVLCFFLLGLLIGKGEIKLPSFFAKKKITLTLSVVFVLLIALLPDGYFTERTKTLMAAGLIYFASRVLRCKWISLITAYSFWIYATHGKLLSIIQITSVKMLPQSGTVILVEYLVLPLVVISICMAAGIIVHRLCPKLYSTLTGGR